MKFTRNNDVENEYGKFFVQLEYLQFDLNYTFTKPGMLLSWKVLHIELVKIRFQYHTLEESLILLRHSIYGSQWPVYLDFWQRILTCYLHIKSFNTVSSIYCFIAFEERLENSSTCLTQLWKIIIQPWFVPN